jgi:hypothetical protein
MTLRGHWPPALGWWVARLLLSTAAALALVHGQGRNIVAAALPALGAATQWVASDFEISPLRFMNDRNNLAVGAMARLSRSIVLGDRAYVPDGAVMGVGVTVGTVLQPLLVAVVLLFTWPARPLELAGRLLLAAPLLAVVLLLDTPFSLAAWLWFAQLQQHDPGAFSLLVQWNVFLNGGGRLLLGLLAAALAIVLAASAAQRLRR